MPRPRRKDPGCRRLASNILVTADGVPKLLDFGIAKLLAEDADVTVTRTGTGMMTPGYAAPEQLRGGAVTTATDVYALGVLLYELLTGRRPFGGSDSSPLEIAEAVERDAPAAPSATLSPSQAPAAAEARATDPRRPRRQIAGDLDRICLMALRKEPDRRYDSAQALVDDLQRHLDARPVVARPDTVGYRTRKFIARNRTGVAAAVLVAVALVAGMAAALWQADIARTEAAKAGEVRDFVLGLFEAGDPALATGDTITVHSLLDRGAQRIENELAGQPALQADMYSLLGPIYARLGLFDDGRTMLTRALDLHAAVSGRASEPHAMATFELARLEHRAGQTDLATRLYRDAGSWLSNVAGPRSAGVARTELLFAHDELPDGRIVVRVWQATLTRP